MKEKLRVQKSESNRVCSMIGCVHDHNRSVVAALLMCGFALLGPSAACGPLNTDILSHQPFWHEKERKCNSIKLVWCDSYLTDGGLHHGIEASLWRIQVPRYELLSHLCFKFSLTGRHVENMSVAKCSLTLLGVVVTWSLQLLLIGVGVWEDCFIHKGTKTW